MFHKTYKELSTIISVVKGVRINLDKARLASILGIRDGGNTVKVDSNRKSVYEDPNWHYEATCTHLSIRPHLEIGGIFFIGMIFQTYYHVL